MSVEVRILVFQLLITVTVLLNNLQQVSSGLPSIARKHLEIRRQHDQTIANRHRRLKREASESCMPYDDDQFPINFTDPDSCDQFFKCDNESKAQLTWCGMSPSFTVLWYDEASGKCKDVHLFPTEHQRRCFQFEGASSKGSTKNFREIFIGRCLTYQTFDHPEFFPEGQEKDCEELYNLFTSIFASKPACGHVPFGSYYDFLLAADVPLIPSTKLLFWSSIKELCQVYTNNGKRAFTLEDTLIGYLLDDLTWCGQVDSDDGINFETCPPWGICKDHPMVTFWQEASEYFAKITDESAILMLDGSMEGRDAFRNWSFFAAHELPNINPRVQILYIFVAHAPGLEIRETCGEGSLLILKNILEEEGFLFFCSDNPAEILHLLCVDAPNDKVCKKKIVPPQIEQVNGEIFGYSIEKVSNKKKKWRNKKKNPK